MPQHFYQHRFDNGLTLLCERMPGMQSAAMTLVVPAGTATDPAGRIGVATVLCDWVLRGAGQRDNRALTDYLDGLGLQRSSSVGVLHTRFGAAAVAANMLQSLDAYADILRRPRLPADGFEPSRDLAVQSLEGIDDDPRQKLIIKLRERHLPAPYNRNTMGVREHLKAMTGEECAGEHARRYRPQGAILALAGNIEFAPVHDRVAALLGDWSGGAEETVILQPPTEHILHEEQDSEQTQIGLAWPSVVETHEDFPLVRLAIEVLSGGMSGRLFTEVREKRGLCYSVWAGYTGFKDYGCVLGYAGTSNDRAQATLDCFLGELERLSRGVTAEELERAKVGVKANVIMQQESTGARAVSIAHDYFLRGRIRTVEEIKATIDGVTVDAVNDYLARSRPGPFTVVTVGPRPLKIPDSL